MAEQNDSTKVVKLVHVSDPNGHLGAPIRPAACRPTPLVVQEAPPIKPGAVRPVVAQPQQPSSGTQAK